jgi:hypothetical protein
VFFSKALMQIEFKPLPKHWSYLLSRKTVKQLVADLNIDFHLVEYLGARRKPSKMTRIYSAGGLDARGLETGWCFRLQLWGLPDRILSNQQEELSAFIQEDIRSFVMDRNLEIPASSYPTLDRRFFLRFEDDLLVPGFSTWKIEGLEDLWAKRSPWWT